MKGRKRETITKDGKLLEVTYKFEDCYDEPLKDVTIIKDLCAVVGDEDEPENNKDKKKKGVPNKDLTYAFFDLEIYSVPKDMAPLPEGPIIAVSDDVFLDMTMFWWFGCCKDTSDLIKFRDNDSDKILTPTGIFETDVEDRIYAEAFKFALKYEEVLRENGSEAIDNDMVVIMKARNGRLAMPV